MLLAAGRRDFLISTSLQLVGRLGIVAQLVIGQRALQALLTAGQAGSSLGTIVPWAFAVGAVSTRTPGWQSCCIEATGWGGRSGRSTT